MNQIMVPDIFKRPTLLEQDLEHRLIAGDIVKDLSCIFSPRFYVVVGFTRDLKGEPEFLWCTKPSLLSSNPDNGGKLEIRVYPVIGHSTWVNYTLGNSSLPWLRIIKRHLESPYLDERKYFFSCLEALKFQRDSFQQERKQ